MSYSDTQYLNATDSDNDNSNNNNNDNDDNSDQNDGEIPWGLAPLLYQRPTTIGCKDQWNVMIWKEQQ